MPQELQYNWYPFTIEVDTGKASAENPQANTPAVAVSSDNIVSAGGGSILKDGFLQSPNFVKGYSGWKINAAGNAYFQVITAAGYIQVFRQAAIPTSLHINDIWIDTDDGNKYYVALKVGATTIAAGEWVLTTPAAAWSTIADDDGNKPADNATVGATFGLNVAGGGSENTQVSNDGYATLYRQTVFGDGSDGDKTVSVDESLTADAYYDNLTINTTKTLNTNGFRVFVKGILNCAGTGKIASNGNAGGNGGNGTGGVNGTAGAAGAIAYSAGSLPIPLVGKAGGAGQGHCRSGKDRP